jgi:hypothetical protein
MAKEGGCLDDPMPLLFAVMGSLGTATQTKFISFFKSMSSWV